MTRTPMELVKGTPPVIAACVGGFAIHFPNVESARTFVAQVQEMIEHREEGCPRCGSRDLAFTVCILADAEARDVLDRMFDGLVGEGDTEHGGADDSGR